MTFQELTFAGHSAVFIKTDSMTIAVDPWLEANPACPDSCKNPESMNLIVLTHGHADHAGEAVSLAKKYGSTIAATYELALLMIKEGVPESNVIPMNKGGTVDFNGVTVSLTHAMHSNSYDTSEGTQYAGEACGIVLGDGNSNIYHAGDTALFSDMSLIKAAYQPTLALLPIGDRFTMGPVEAAQAANLVGCKRAIPIHYGTFDLLTGTVEEFQAACNTYDIESIHVAPGETYQLN